MGLDHDRARVLQAESDAFAFRARMAEEAIRQNAMLRHTLAERIADATEGIAACGSGETKEWFCAKRYAYRDVLFLLGPEPAWYEDCDSGEPF